MGFYAAPDAPRGTGRKMEYLALEYVFSCLSLHKLYCEALAFNTAVIGLHQKHGFREEGVFRQQYARDGKYEDIFRLGILSSEWQTHKPALWEKLCGK